MLRRVRDLQRKLDLVVILSYSLSRDIESSAEMKDYDRVCIYVDSDFQAEDSFTVRAVHRLSTGGSHSPRYSYWRCSLFNQTLVLLFKNMINKHLRKKKKKEFNSSTSLEHKNKEYSVQEMNQCRIFFLCVCVCLRLCVLLLASY